jgi:cell division protein FtsB
VSDRNLPAPGAPPPSLLERLKAWLQAQGAQVQPASREVADAMNAKLPDQLSARPAIEEAARRRAMMDELLRNADR